MKQESLNLYTMKEIRLLTEKDIDVRVAQTTETDEGVVEVNLLLYKDARVDMRILDELFTPLGWRRSHKLIGDRLYCSVDVFNETTGEWICKEDVGVESNTEAEKGQASDAFKRACFNWGIGRELYSAPRIKIELRKGEYKKYGDRIRVWGTFYVKSIGYDKDRIINSLEIVDRFGNLRFSLGQPIQTTAPSTAPSTQRGRKKQTEEVPQQPAYEPCDDETYWNFVKCHAEGTTCKSGLSCKDAWIKRTHPTQDAINKFDLDVDNYRISIH